MNILLTNDDGIMANGLRAMYAALRAAGHTVRVVAPVRQQSGVGHSLTVFEPVRAMEYNEPDFCGTGIYGTPTDCVKLALGNLLPCKPDLVISGINAGPNVGPDILYSGTVAAATEAAHENLPSIAVSYDGYNSTVEEVLPQANHLAHLAERLDWSQLRPRRVINVNYPKCPLAEVKGLRVCPQTSAVWLNSYSQRQDPRGAPYWWLEGEIPPESIEHDSDKDLLNKGYITITPLRFDFTDAEGLRTLQSLAAG